MVKSESHRTVIICIDSYADGVPVGWMYNLHLKEIQPFRSLTQLLFMMERGLDELKFPQAFETIRRFDAPRKAFEKDDGKVQMLSGKLATFSIRILFRQNASWQGSVNWLEGGVDESFRSVLELISLMDSALSDNRIEQLES